MARILLGVTGSVAAIRTPDLFESLRVEGHHVKIAVTRSARYFFDDALFDRSAADHGSVATDKTLLRDEDEWPGTRYHRGDPVLHIELRKWADLLVVAPLDANTLAKFALGISDNLLSCVYRAWEPEKPIILAPAMNTRMWESPVTLRHLRQIVADHSDTPFDGEWSLGDLPDVVERVTPRLVLIPPQSKRLACGDTGVGAMAEVVTISSIVQSWISRSDATETGGK